MKKIVLLVLLVSCAHKGQQIESDNFVTVQAALNQAQASYLKGCIEIVKEQNLTGNFETCKGKSINHRKEIQFIMDQNP